MTNFRLLKKYEEEIVPKLGKELSLDNLLAVPKITKVVVNMGVGDTLKDESQLEQAKKDLATITGQLPNVRPAKVSVASFGIRRGMPVGLAVTLRGPRMYAFLDRLFSVVLPRLRDFRGLAIDSFDKHGNYSIGISEHTVFPEIDMSKTNPRGLEITIVTDTKDAKLAKKLLEELGMPFEDRQEKLAKESGGGSKK